MMSPNGPLEFSYAFARTLVCLFAPAVLFSLNTVTAMADVPAADAALQYNRDIRPILVDACFACHGPDSASRKADLRLDQRDPAIEMEAIAPGNPEESEMIRRVLSTDPDEAMPPPETKKTLTEEQKQTLTRWIQEGAEYELHWSFIPPERSEPPMVKNPSWVRNPIDQFVAARVEVSGLAPAEEADRRTLARRVSLDLIGLPPTPERVEAFVNDESSDAYEKLVDALLASTNWGEHRGRYWLDYARYADSNGVHFDNYREMWTYRDWVIQAFNQNMPFDQFTIESLAGDLLPNHTRDQLVGSGFNRCNMTTNEGGIINEEYLVLYTRDRVEATSQVWLGLTTGCAVCHDHKFDPISQHEFYEMAAFFNNTTQVAKDGNIKDTPPVIIIPRDEEDVARWEKIPSQITQAKQEMQLRRDAAMPEFEDWLTRATAETLNASIPQKGLHLRARLDEGQGKILHIEVDGEQRDVPLADSASWQEGPTGKAIQVQGAACELADVGDFEKEQPFTCTAWIKLHPNDTDGAICARMNGGNANRGWDFWMERRRIGMHLINTWPDDALKVVCKEQVPENEWVHVAVSYNGSSKAAGIAVYYNGKPQKTNVGRDRLLSPIKTDVPLKIGQRSSGGPLSASGIQNLQIFKRVLSPPEIESMARMDHFAKLLAKSKDQRTKEEVQEFYDFWLGTLDESSVSASLRRGQLEHEQKKIKARGTVAHVMQEKKAPAEAYVLFRGEYDQRRDKVTPATPKSLPPFPETLPRNRLGFAQWLLLPEHPLTARVTVNRYWQEVFGTGIVATSGDFGVSGQLPSHPKLLDWLAVEFRESGWDIKKLFKLMVMSATYRQAGTTTPEKQEKDPANRLLTHGPRFRMDAEMVRDYALAVSGLLVQKLGGPSVKPYQPPGVWKTIAMIGSNTRSYQPGTGDDLYRRSLYTFIKRMAPPASMDIFNAPNREFCVVSRARTNTPLQALVTLNDEQFIEAARHVAQLVLQGEDKNFQSRLKSLGLRLLAREFRPAEVPIIEKSYQDLLAFYAEHPDQADQLLRIGESKAEASIGAPMLATWTMLTNELMNLDEVLNK